MDRDFDADLGVMGEVFDRPALRRNPGSVAEMLAVLRDEMAKNAPKSDAELAALYGDDDVDDDEKWDDRDPAYQHRFDD